MKFHLGLFLCLILASNVFATQKQDWRQGVRYQIEAELDTTAKRLTGYVKIFYKNNSPDTLRKIYLQVPANAFHDEENTAVKEMRRFTSDNVRFDHMRHHKLTIQSLQFLAIGLETEFPIQAYDFSDTILDLTLPNELLPNDSLTFGVSFFQDFKSTKRKKSGNVRIPTEYVFWFPRLSVYDEDGWNNEPFHFMMEAKDVYSEFADYDVTLTVPLTYILAGSGEVIEGDLGWEMVRVDTSMNDSTFKAWRDSVNQNLAEIGLKEGPRRVRFTASRLQNFTWSASPKTVYFHHPYKVPMHILFRGSQKEWLKNVLERFDRVFDYLQDEFGPYPFEQLIVIRTSGELNADPMIARFRDDDHFGLAYELAGLYFPGIVGSNGVKETWLAKGLQVYMGKMYSEKVHGKRGYDLGEAREDMNFFEKQYPLPGLDEILRNLSLLYMESGQNEPIAKTIYGYKDPLGTMFNVYLKSEIFYEMLRHVVGDSIFTESTREIVRRHSFTHIKEKDLQAVFEEKHGQDLDWFFDQWLRRTPTVDYQKGKITKHKRADGTWVTEVELKRKGDGIMPVDVAVDLGDGRKLVKRWDGKDESATLVFETKEKPKNVEVDPDDRIMDSNRLNNTDTRLELHPDWPLLKYIHMPNDAILVLWRPLIGFNDPDAVRLGIGTRSSYRAFYHNLDLEMQFGVKSKELDGKIGYSNPLSRKSLMNRYSVMVRKDEGRFETDANLIFRGSAGMLAGSGRSLQIGVNYSDLLNDIYTFRKVRSDTGRFEFDEWEDAGVLLAYAEGKTKYDFGPLNTESRIRGETALPGGDVQFTKLWGRLSIAAQAIGFKATVRGNLATSFGPDRLPLQDQFRAEGAAARERFHHNKLKSRAGQHTRRHVEGGGFLRGYAGQPLPAERFTTVNFEINTASPYLGLRLFGFYDTGRIWLTRDSDSFVRSDAGFGLAFLGDEFELFGGNLSLFGNFSAKLVFPVWLSDPLPGEKKMQFRWYFTLGKGL